MCSSAALETVPRVWIGCLACYSQGRLVGDWFDAVSADQVTTYDIHGSYSRADSHDELWVFDHEYLPVTGELSPHDAALWAKVIIEVEECQRPALYAWVLTGDYVAQGNGDLPSISDFEERYAGQWESFAEYAMQLAEDIGLLAEIPEEISRYLDWESWTRDLRFDHMTADAPGGGIYVFRSL